MTDLARPLRLPASLPESLERAALAMDAGRIVGIPTETVYGIGVVPRPESLQALVTAKQRPEDKGIALLIDGLDQVGHLVSLSSQATRLAGRLWPGALTLVLPLLRPGLLPAIVTGGRETVALRVPDHPVPRALARQLGPIAVTSANRSGMPPAQSADELVTTIGPSLALVLDDGPVRGGVASTVVALDADGSWRILREGAVDAATIADAIQPD